MESQCSISSTFKGIIIIIIWTSVILLYFFIELHITHCSESGVTGLDPLPGSKRKCPHFKSNEEDVELSDSFTRSVHLTPIKRLKESHDARYGVGESHKITHFSNSSSDYHEDMHLHNSRGCLQNSPCNVEDALSKGFEGCISMKCPF
jgi:DCN1-like protein 1/2